MQPDKSDWESVAPTWFGGDVNVSVSERETKRQSSWKYLCLSSCSRAELLERCKARDVYNAELFAEEQSAEDEVAERMREVRSHRCRVVTAKLSLGLEALERTFAKRDLTILQQKAICRSFIKKHKK